MADYRLGSFNHTVQMWLLQTDMTEIRTPPSEPFCLYTKSNPFALDVLTHFMFSWIVRNLYGIQLEATVALSYVIYPGDVGAHFIDHLHKLWAINNEASALDK